MKENIETKDVQRTEYLDKNGLDMLWTNVKENTHNQVEVERNRATTQENRIIETKVDKSELHSNYVSNSTFIALQEKVSANTDAISNKQDAGNYIPYYEYLSDGTYRISGICVEGNTSSDGLISAIDKRGLSVVKYTNGAIYSKVQGAKIELQSDKNRVRINDEGIDIWELDVHDVDGISHWLLSLSKRGIKLYGGDDNHVLTSNYSTIDITQYVLKSVYDEKIAALEARIAALEAKHTETA